MGSPAHWPHTHWRLEDLGTVGYENLELADCALTDPGLRCVSC